jgi:uncharacterized oligopeptide transporter (OPT) family protein
LNIADEHFEDSPLMLDGFQGTREEIEQQWLAQVYRGRGDIMPQLTLRSVLMGSAIGGILSITNIYIGLKVGWLVGVSVTACIVSYGLWSAFLRIGLVKTPMTILETNCMQSTASAAGYSTGMTLISAFPAFFMISGHELPIMFTLAWVFFLALLGVTMAIPMKRQMINVEQLRFPSGIATAETLRALYSNGRRAAQSARALTYAGIAAALSEFLSDGLRLINARLSHFELGALLNQLDMVVFGPVWMGRTIMLVWDPILIAVGALIGIRVAGSMLLGGTLCWAVFVPILQRSGMINGSGYTEVVQWTLWGGVSCIVAASLFSLALQWELVRTAMRGLRSFLAGDRTPNTRSVSIEPPLRWFFLGQGVSLAALCWLAYVSFRLPVWQSAIAVGMASFLALVACRVTGETGTTPVGAMGKVTQLFFGAINPGNITINIMSASITAGAAVSSADLLGDLKAGHLLGANPRKQFIAQFCGIFTGTVATVFGFKALVPTIGLLGTDRFPAPAAQAWRAVALALSRGFGVLEPVKLWSIAVGGLVGIILTVVPRLFPRLAKWCPSASAIGLSWTFHWYYGLLFVGGASAAWLTQRKFPKRAELFTYPVAAGIIAGGSLMAVALILWESGPSIFAQIFDVKKGATLSP